MTPLPGELRPGVALLALFLAVVACWNAPPPTRSAVVVVLAVAAVSAELCAPRAPKFGYFAASAVFCLATLGSSWAGPWLGVPLVFCGALLRRGDWWMNLALGGIPVLAALAAGSRLEGVALLVAGLTYFAVGLWIPEAVSQRLPETYTFTLEDRLDLGVLCGSVAAMGLVSGLLLKVQPWAVLGLLAVLPALSRVVESSDLRRRTERHEEARLAVGQVSDDLKQTRATVDRLEERLKRKHEEVRLLEELSRELARAGNLKETMDSLVEVCYRLTYARTIVLFLAAQGRLAPAAHRSPYPELDEDGSREPVVRRAWESGQLQRGGSEPTEERLFPVERSALALPLGDLGVLYLGQADEHRFDEAVLELIAALAAQGRLALGAANQRQSELDAHARLKEWNARLRVLWQSSQAMASTLEIDPLLDGVVGLLDRLAPHQSHFLLCLEPERIRSQNKTGTEKDLMRAARMVIEHGPLLTSQLEESPVSFMGPSFTSLLAVPVKYEGEGRGAFLLGSSEPGAFQAVDLDLILVLAYQVAGAFERARLHNEVVDAFQRLRESEAQLVQSTKMAAIGQLAAGIAHELNTPLGTIKLGAQYARRNLKEKPEVADKRLGIALEAVEQAMEIVSKLLYYSREATLEGQTFDLNQVVKDTLGFLVYHLERDGVLVETELNEIPQVTGNQNELHQVLNNLILNARDAIVEGDYPREISVRTALSEEGVSLWVRDGGPGVDQEIANRIFDPFFTTKAVGEGTGLGLSVSRQILAKHGGSLQLETQPGSGAVFRLTLPEKKE